MSEQLLYSGWLRLPSGLDVEVQSGVPVRISDNGQRRPVPDNQLCDEIHDRTGLNVTLGDWTSQFGDPEEEAAVTISSIHLREVLHREALASAALYVDRFHHAINHNAIDWDRMEFAQDFHWALDRCHLGRNEVDQEACRDEYVEAMHRESERLTALSHPPRVAAG